MNTPAKINLVINQGSTFSQQFRWESESKVYVPIIAIEKSAPVRITVEDPSLLPPIGWRVRITNVSGMRQINMEDEDTFELLSEVEYENYVAIINAINSLSYSYYTSGGVLSYNKPVDLEGIRARMHIRKKITDTEIIHTLTSENGGIIFDNILKRITLYIPYEITTNFNFTTAVYQLEFIMGVDVYRFAEGNITLKAEVTR